MFISKLFLTTLAVASMAHAQSKVCSEKQNKIDSQADIDKIASCTTLEGDVVIGEDIGAVNIPNVQQIKGSFIAKNIENLRAIDLASLRIISKDFVLNELITLNTLNCPQLATVGTINWVKLPELRGVGLDRKITEAESVLISDTRLESLDGIDLRTASTFRVDNCKSLKTVTVGLRNVSVELALEFNGKALDISFPELIWASNITVRDATSVKLPKLSHVNGTAYFEENLFTKVECKKLEVVEQSLAFIGNDKLTELNFPALIEIGGAFKLANNTALEVVDDFEKLQTVGGAIDFSGVFTNVTLSGLEDVLGGFHLETKEELDCSAFEAMKGQVIQGDDFTCKTKVAHPESKDGSVSTGDDSEDDSGKDTGAAGKMTIGSALGLTVAAIFVAAF